MAEAERDGALRTEEPERQAAAAPAGPAFAGPVAQVLALQRSAGNAAVTRYLLREGSAGGVPTAPPPAPAGPGDQSSAGGPPAPAGAPDWEKLIADKDIGGIKGVRDFSGASAKQRMQMNEVLLDQVWVGMNDEAAIVRLWEPFGRAGIAKAYDDRKDLWDASIERGAQLHNLSFLQDVRTAFEGDVKALAHLYMDKNRKSVIAEGQRLGLGHLNDPMGVSGQTAAPNEEKVKEVQQLAREIQRADEAVKGLESIAVGTSYEYRDTGGMGDGTHERQTVSFTPGKPPEYPGPAGDPNFRSYAEVEKQHKSATAARAVLLSSNPALYALTQGDKDAAGKLAAMSPAQAAAELKTILTKTWQKIDETDPKVDTGALDWRDLTPIHKQLFDGLSAKSGVDWSQKLYQSVGKGQIGDYEAKQFWVQLGLGTLAAAAFIFSEIATGGMATFLWAAAGMAASATQAGMSIEKYSELASAAQTATSEDTRLVSDEKVSEAKVAAVLDTVFVFLDAYGAVKGVAGAVKATAARKGLEGLAKMGKEEAAKAIETAVRDLGPEETIRRTGKSVDELVELAGGEATEAGKKLRGAAGDVTLRPASGTAGELAAPTEASRKLAGALEHVYTNWATMTVEQRAAALIAPINEQLKALGCPPLKLKGFSKAGRSGELDFTSWTLHVKDEVLQSPTITKAKFTDLVDTVAHEGEHGSQWFKMAQVEAMGGADAAAIAKKLEITDEVAQAAIDVQNGSRPGAKLAGGAAEAEARLFWESVYGAGREDRQKLLGKLDDAWKAVDTAKSGAKAVEKLPQDHDLRKRALQRLEEARKARDALLPDYVRLPEEAAAFKAGGSASAAMQERFALMRELAHAERGEKALVDLLKPVEEKWFDAFTKGEVPYEVKVERDLLRSRHGNALHRVMSAQEALDRAAKGVKP